MQWPEGSYSEEQPPRHHTLWPWLNPGKGQPLMREAAPPHPLRALEVRALGSPGQTCSQRAGLWWWKPPPPPLMSIPSVMPDRHSHFTLHPPPLRSGWGYRSLGRLWGPQGGEQKGAAPGRVCPGGGAGPSASLGLGRTLEAGSGWRPVRTPIMEGDSCTT